jgi:regulator of cell morphogenesis and NO signaling
MVFSRPEFGSICHPIWMIEQDHQTIAAILREAAALARGCASSDAESYALAALRKAFDSFESHLYRHIHLENNILFPRAIRLEGEASGG